MVIGVDLGGMSAKAALLQQAGLAGKSRVATSANDSPEQTAVALAKLCTAAAEKAAAEAAAAAGEAAADNADAAPTEA